MSDAVAALGVTLSRAGVAVAEIIEMGNVKFERNMIDVSHHGNTYEEFIPAALIRTGELTFVCNSILSDTAQDGIKSDWVNKSSAAYAITFPDGQGFTGTAYVTAYEYETALEDQIKLTVTLKWSGAVSETDAASNNLSNLVITTATLYPAFAAATYDYAAVSTADSCTVTASFGAGTCTLYKNGVLVQALVTATPSGSISLGSNGDLNTLTIVVQETGKGAKTYTVRIANSA